MRRGQLADQLGGGAGAGFGAALSPKARLWTEMILPICLDAGLETAVAKDTDILEDFTCDHPVPS